MKNKAKWGAFIAWTHVDATWHARPRGPTRVPAWHKGDIYILYLLYIGYSTYRHSIEELANRYNPPHLINPMNLLLFLRVGLCSLLLFCFQNAWHIVERWIQITRNGACRCGGREVHPIFNHARGVKWT